MPSPNAGPSIRLVSPGPHIENQAIARAHLDDSLTSVDSNYGEVPYFYDLLRQRVILMSPKYPFLAVAETGQKQDAELLTVRLPVLP